MHVSNKRVEKNNSTYIGPITGEILDNKSYVTLAMQQTTSEKTYCYYYDIMTLQVWWILQDNYYTSSMAVYSLLYHQCSIIHCDFSNNYYKGKVLF